MGIRKSKTPHLDRLFKQGLLFTNAHASQAVCTASRNSLLSGIHPAYSGWYSVDQSHATDRMTKSWETTSCSRSTFATTVTAHSRPGKIFHQGASDYPEQRIDFWDEVAPTTRSQTPYMNGETVTAARSFIRFPKRSAD